MTHAIAARHEQHGTRHQRCHQHRIVPSRGDHVPHRKLAVRCLAAQQRPKPRIERNRPERGIGIDVDPHAASLLQERERAREARDFDTADRIRDQLRALEWEIRDGPDGPELIPMPAP